MQIRSCIGILALVASQSWTNGLIHSCQWYLISIGIYSHGLFIPHSSLISLAPQVIIPIKNFSDAEIGEKRVFKQYQEETLHVACVILFLPVDIINPLFTTQSR